MKPKLLLLSIAAFLMIGVFFTELSFCDESEVFEYKSKNKRDPFVPLISSYVKTYASLEDVETVDDLLLEGILWDPVNGSIAILNGVLLKEGDMVSNIRVKNIGHTNVILEIDDLEYELTLQKKEE